MDARLVAGCQGGTGSAARFLRGDSGCSVVCGSQKPERCRLEQLVAGASVIFCGTVAEPLGENPELQFVQPHGENVEAGQVQPGESGERMQTGK